MALVRRDEPASRQLSGEGRLLFIASALHQASQNSPVLADLLLGRSGKINHRWFIHTCITLCITLRSYP
jgi:hypothetical protein